MMMTVVMVVVVMMTVMVAVVVAAGEIHLSLAVLRAVKGSVREY